MLRVIFPEEKIKYYDIFISVAFLLVLVVFCSWDLFFETEKKAEIIIYTYAFAYPGMIYGLLYKPFRNFYVYIFWLLMFSSSSWFTFCHLTNENIINDLDVNKIVILKYAWFYILLILILRIISKLWQRKELVAPITSALYLDLFDDRRITFVDVFCFFIYFIFWFGLKTISEQNVGIMP